MIEPLNPAKATTLASAARPIEPDPLYYLRPELGHGSNLATLTAASEQHSGVLPCTGRADEFTGWDAPGRSAPTDEEAIDMCHGCPILEQCHAYATLAEPFGVWAGKVYGRDEQNGGIDPEETVC